MEKITSFQQPVSLFHSRYTRAIRLWHWLTFLVITGSILMVLLAFTLFATSANVSLVQEQVAQKGGMVTAQQAKAVAHEFRDKLWEVHTYLGFGLAFLLLSRIVIEATYSHEQKLKTKIRHAITLQTASADARSDRKHFLMVKWGYVFFYGMLLVMVVTGLVMALEDVAFFRSIRKPFAQVHSIGQYLMYAYILFHIAGVIRADLTDNKGIVSRMINGGRE